MLARVPTAGLAGLTARPVTVEVDLARGLPSFHVVGLPGGAVRESRERVWAALANSGFPPPVRRITVNLAPADEPKAGTGFDFPIALGILMAGGILSGGGPPPTAALGELALDGGVRPVPGTLPIAAALHAAGTRELLVAPPTAAEAALVRGLRVVAVPTLRAAVEHLSGLAPIPESATVSQPPGAMKGPDWREVRGQGTARRALEIAAAGGHNILLVGPPGAGKTFLARRFPTILPDLDDDRALEVTAIHSAWGRLSPDRPLIRRPPFRAPHHTISTAALLGGGQPPRPGEVSLSHRGVLFLDELPEFRRDALEGLRQPIEDGEVIIGRTGGRHRFPTRFVFLGAMNACPCGHWGEPLLSCRCTPTDRHRYRSRLSGPLLDRIDLHVRVRRVSFEDLMEKAPAESSAEVRRRVVSARGRQRDRLGAAASNAEMGPADAERDCGLGAAETDMLAAAHERLALSARGHGRILRVARTIADLDRSASISIHHLAEAIQFRARAGDEDDGR